MQSSTGPDPANPKTWLVTGGSSGIGRALCERVLAAGDRVVATGRNTAALEDLAAGADRARAVVMDVADTASVERGIAEAIAWAGRIDVLVNNAGYGIVGALEEVPEEEVRRAFETNVLGAYRVTRAVLPHMRGQGGGRILNVSSALGLVARGGYTVYCATKFALEGLMEAVAQEVAPFGITVILVEPGSFRTPFRSGDSMYAAPVQEPYREVLAQFRQGLIDSDGKQPGDPVRGAEAIYRIASEANPPLRFLMGEHTVSNVRRKLADMGREVDRWAELSLSTSFPD